MPKGYDRYLLGSLCQSDSDENAGLPPREMTPARRPSLTDAMPRIMVQVQGCGVSMSVRVGPHVRWTKILAKWASAFPDPSVSPMAWPVTVETGGTSHIPITSIQESISRTLGPELLVEVSDREPAFIVTVGQLNRVNPVEEADVTPSIASAIDDPVVEAGPDIEPLPETFEEIAGQTEKATNGTIRVKVEASFVTNALKLNVSSGCLVSRLVRKWIQALKSNINPEVIVFHYNGRPLDGNKKLSEVLPSCVDERVIFQAHVAGSEASPQKEPKKPKRQERTPPTTAPKRPRSDEQSSSSEVVSEQVEQLLFWQHIKDAGIAGTSEISDENEDDDLALAIALSLSESIT